MRPIYRPTAQPFPVMETSIVTVVNSYSFAISGCDPWSYISGNAIGIEQSGILRPAIVQDCRYDNANTRTVITVSVALNVSVGLRVWKALGSDRYYMLGGGAHGIWSFVPGGMIPGAAIVDTEAAIRAGRFADGGSHALMTTGSPVYSSDISILGGSPLKLGSDKAIAFGNGWSQPSYRGGCLIRCHINLSSLADPFNLLYSYWPGQNQNMIQIKSNGAIFFYSQSNGMGMVYVNVSTPVGYIVSGSTCDLCIEQDFANNKIRVWIDGFYKVTLTASYTMQYPLTPWAVGQNSGLNYDPYSGSFSHGVPGTPIYGYISDYLVLNYAPILADNVNIPPVNKFFSYPGLREAA